nr:MAG TPA: deoxyribosyltransferase [Caudoviricetes sp.]
MRSEEYMRICVAMMSIADCVAFIPDWEESHGAQVEYAWCKYVGKPMMGLQGDER